MSSEALDAGVGGRSARRSPTWPRSCAAGWLAIVAGPLVGLAVVMISVEVAAVAGGWPAPTFDTGGIIAILPRGRGISALLDPVVFGAGWYADASVRLWLFRRVASADASWGTALVSVVLAPGLWALEPAVGRHLAGVCLWSLLACPAVLRWNSHAMDAALRPRLERRVAWALAALVVAGAGSAALLLTDGRNVEVTTSYASVRVGTASTGYDVRQTLPVRTLIGRRRPAATVYYDVEVGTDDSALPLTLTGAHVVATGPSLQVVGTRFFADGGSVGTATSRVAIDRTDPATLRVVLRLRACPAGAPPTVSTISALAVDYTTLGIGRSIRLRPAPALRVSCR